MLTKDTDEYYDRRQSGLSGMLAAFPPPAQAQSRQGNTRPGMRGSVLSWPPFNRSNNTLTPRGPPGEMTASDSNPAKKGGRRCCGLPFWGFIMLMIIIIIVIVAAVIVPVEFFVIRRQNVSSSTMAEAEQQCQSQINCQNGGTNVVTDGICSCICTNDFTGFDCSTADDVGCTTADIGGDANTSNATLGDALPRLLSAAQTNFSISLDGTTILSKLNAGNLSCSAENALVTFEGESTSLGTRGISEAFVEAAAVKDDSVATITVMAGPSSTTTLTIDITSSTSTSTSASSTPPTTTITVTQTYTAAWPPASSTASATTTSASSSATSSSSTFNATSEVLDFARVGVLYILQQDTLDDATTAQSTLQMFFSEDTTTVSSASNISLSSGYSIDLVNFHIDVGAGLVGSSSTTSKRAFEETEPDLWARTWTGPLKSRRFLGVIENSGN